MHLPGRGPTPLELVGHHRNHYDTDTESQFPRKYLHL